MTAGRRARPTAAVDDQYRRGRAGDPPSRAVVRTSARSTTWTASSPRRHRSTARGSRQPSTTCSRSRAPAGGVVRITSVPALSRARGRDAAAASAIRSTASIASNAVQRRLAARSKRRGRARPPSGPVLHRDAAGAGGSSRLIFATAARRGGLPDRLPRAPTSRWPTSVARRQRSGTRGRRRRSADECRRTSGEVRHVGLRQVEPGTWSSPRRSSRARARAGLVRTTAGRSLRLPRRSDRGSGHPSRRARSRRSPPRRDWTVRICSA